MVRVSGRPRGAGILIKNTPSSNQNRAKHTLRTPLSSNSPLTLDPLLISPWEGEGWLLAGEGDSNHPSTVAHQGRRARTPPILAKLAFHHVCNKPGPG